MNDVFSKEGILFIAQVDHLNGEIIGSIFDMFYEVGALNVQCIPTITKKNRPGNIFLIDVPSKKVDLVERIIIEELGSTGWHKIESNHRHIPTQIIEKEVIVIIGFSSFNFIVVGKQIRDNPESIRVEHSNAIALKERIKETTRIDIALKLIYTKIQVALLSDEQEIIFSGNSL